MIKAPRCSHVIWGNGCHGRGDRRRVEHDLGAAMSIVGNCEVRSPRGKQRQRVRDDAAVHRKMMARLVVGRAGAEVEFEAGQVEGIVLAKKVDRVGEGVARERRIVDRELCLDSVRLARRRPERGTMPRCQLSESVHRIEMAHEASPAAKKTTPGQAPPAPQAWRAGPSRMAA